MRVFKFVFIIFKTFLFTFYLSIAIMIIIMFFLNVICSWRHDKLCPKQILKARSSPESLYFKKDIYRMNMWIRKIVHILNSMYYCVKTLHIYYVLLD